MQEKRNVKEQQLKGYIKEDTELDETLSKVEELEEVRTNEFAE